MPIEIIVPSVSRSRDHNHLLTSTEEMSTGLVRAAFCSFLTETVDLSDRNKKARDSVKVFLDQITDESARKKLDEFAALLCTEVEESVSSCVSAAPTCRAKSVLRQQLLRSFHLL